MKNITYTLLVFLISVVFSLSCKKELTPAEEGKEVIQITSSYFLKADGTVWEVGSKDRTTRVYTGTNTPVQIADNTKKIEEFNHSLFILKNDNTLWVRGLNTYGEFGIASPASTNTFVRVATNVKDVDCKFHSLMVLKNDNTLWVSGYNNFGQLGLGHNTNVNTLTRLDNNVIQIASGIHHCLYMKSDSTIWGMGKNDRGQLLNGTTLDRNVPTRLALSLSGIKKFKSDFFSISHFLTNTNELWSTSMASGIIKIADDVSDFEFIGTDYVSMYRILKTSKVLLDYNKSTNVETLRSLDVKAFYKNRIIKSDNEVWGVGPNFKGTMGDEDEKRGFLEYKKISNAITDINYGNSRLYYIKNNKLYESNTSFTSFSEVQTQVNKIFTSSTHVLIIKNDNSLWGKGLNNSGQLGNGNTARQDDFIKIADNVVKATVNDSNMMYSTYNGDLYICGSNSFGQCGINPTINSLITTPVQLPTLDGLGGGFKTFEIGANKAYVLTRFFGYKDDLSGVLISSPEYYTYTPLGYNPRFNVPASFSPSSVIDIKCNKLINNYATEPIYLVGGYTNSIHYVHFNYVNPSQYSDLSYPSLSFMIDDEVLYYYPTYWQEAASPAIIYQKVNTTSIHYAQFLQPRLISPTNNTVVIPTIEKQSYAPDYVEKIALIDKNTLFYLGYDNKIYRYTLGGSKTFITQ